MTGKGAQPITGFVITRRGEPVTPSAMRSFAMSEEEAWRLFLPPWAVHDYWIEMARWRVAGYRPRRVTVTEA